MSVPVFTVVIPARFASTRLPGKPLAEIAGKPMIQHVYERACESGATRVIIATDDLRIVTAAKEFGAEVCLTRDDHPSGTDRLQEVVTQLGLPDDHIVVNVQGDEPLIPPRVIDQVAANLQQATQAAAATLSALIDHVDTLFDPNTVKVVSDRHGTALYFSRAPMPWARDDFATDVRRLPKVEQFHRHIGIYAYRVGLLHRFVEWGVSPLEQVESLEQLRILWNGDRIHVDTALETPPHGVDTAEDLHAVRVVLESALA